MRKFWGGALLTVALSTICFVGNVDAESFYTNSNGVEMSQSQYSKMLELFSENRVNVLTQSEFDMLKDSEIVASNSKYYKETYVDGELFANEEITAEEYEEADSENSCIAPHYGSFVETSYKKLSGSATSLSTGKYAIVGALTWKKVPKYKSYDVFAFRLNNFTYSGFTAGQVYYKGSSSYRIDYTTSSEGYKSFSNGIGVSMNLKDDSDITGYDMTLMSTMTAKPITQSYGQLAMSYQHAQTNVSRAQSMNYTLDVTGLGNVIKFGSGVAGYYDGMDGIVLDVPLR